MIANSVAEYLNHIFSEKHAGKTVAYRGHSNAEYKLQSKVYRSDAAKKNEERILSELLTESPEDFKDDRTVFEQLVRAQHYGLATRLIDVTLNPLVGLYFACASDKTAQSDGEVLRFVISQDRVKLFDSDTVSCISNTARLSYSEKNAIFKLFLETKGKGGVSSIAMEEFNKREDVLRLVQYIQTEKPYFSHRINPLHLNQFYFIWPKKSNRRIIAQSGAFISSGLLKVVGEERSTAFDISRISIPRDAKDRILKELDALHVNAKTLFPEIYRVSEYISSKYSD